MRLTRLTSARIGRPGAVLACIAALGLTGIAVGAKAVKRSTPDRSFTLSATPASRTVRAGATTSFVMRARQSRPRGTVRLRIASKLPRGVTARFVRAGGSRWRLRVVTRATTRPRQYRVTIRGTRSRPPRPPAASPEALRKWKSALRKRWRVTLRLRLKVTPPRQPFTISGAATSALTPGGTAPVDARITNPNAAPLRVTTLRVAVAGISAADAAGCTLADFGSAPYGGPALTVPGRATRSLSQLGIAPELWPRLLMLNRPVRQDGCRGASLTLSFDGTGQVAQ